MKKVYLDSHGNELLVIENSFFPPIELKLIGRNIVFQGYYRKLINCTLNMGVLTLTVGEKMTRLLEYGTFTD